MKISKTMRAALVDCSKYDGKFSVYHWKPKTMEKAVALGLARRQADPRGQFGVGYVLTNYGRARLEESE